MCVSVPGLVLSLLCTASIRKNPVSITRTITRILRISCKECRDPVCGPTQETENIPCSGNATLETNVIAVTATIALESLALKSTFVHFGSKGVYDGKTQTKRDYTLVTV